MISPRIKRTAWILGLWLVSQVSWAQDPPPADTAVQGSPSAANPTPPADMQPPATISPKKSADSKTDDDDLDEDRSADKPPVNPLRERGSHGMPQGVPYRS